MRCGSKKRKKSLPGVARADGLEFQKVGESRLKQVFVCLKISQQCPQQLRDPKPPVRCTWNSGLNNSIDNTGKVLLHISVIISSLPGAGSNKTKIKKKWYCI